MRGGMRCIPELVLTPRNHPTLNQFTNERLRTFLNEHHFSYCSQECFSIIIERTD